MHQVKYENSIQDTAGLKRICLQAIIYELFRKNNEKSHDFRSHEFEKFDTNRIRVKTVAQDRVAFENSLNLSPRVKIYS